MSSAIMLSVIYAECNMLRVTDKPFMLSVIMLNVVMLSVVMLSVVMLNFVPPIVSIIRKVSISNP